MTKLRVGSEQDALVGTCAVYEAVLGLQFVACSKPDAPLVGQRQQSKAADLLAWTEAGERLAVEHTRFMTVDGQAKVESEFAPVRAGLALPSGVAGTFLARVRLRGNAIPRGLRMDLEEWLAREAAQVPLDVAAKFRLRRSRLDLVVSRQTTSGSPRLFIQAQRDVDLAAEAPRMTATLAEAVAKFAGVVDARRAVVLHSDDFQNLGSDTVEGWIRSALTPAARAGLDDVWWLDTYPGDPVVHFFTCWWSSRDDPIGTVFSAEWIPGPGPAELVHAWADDRPWWRRLTPG